MAEWCFHCRWLNDPEKPGLYGETFYNRESRYSLNCQVVVMPHNLIIMDYALGHPGSVHDAWAFQGTHITSNPPTFIPCNHWTWADSAYPTGGHP
ncbi:hypothetical protein PAXINDRAFT_93582 [Paxillus involutus ATCC 200175]|uniref:DDE Tnp4 domain-containing protein n=1 Tax=Paxillus involutus ATCC 200175 TaxID=664439 RepID=A0A0C9TDM5_PAXIN|nr:hypothetical protein PAXINDRAFT_93582 [Paxillus involutus ATCC 200175]